MIAHSRAYEAYASTSSTKSAKDNESEIILEATRRLKAADQKKQNNFPSFAAALQTNRRLWIILASDVADPKNRLPEGLRAQLFYLGEFVQKYSRDVLTEGLDIHPLLDINLAILRGLGTKAGEE